MTEEEKDNFKCCEYRMKEEGFHYCFEGYSDFKEIEDEEFHKLRLEYLSSAKSLENYVKEKAKEE